MVKFGTCSVVVLGIRLVSSGEGGQGSWRFNVPPILLRLLVLIVTLVAILLIVTLVRTRMQRHRRGWWHGGWLGISETLGLAQDKKGLVCAIGPFGKVASFVARGLCSLL